jgi:4-amino-4-deoxy-L-arabinose transferase-like glycosyltransferase
MVFLAFVAISLLTRAVLLPVDIIDVDEAAHITGSWELMRGKLLYTDFVDNKPPLLYVYYALAQLILGRGMTAVRLLTTLLTIPATAYAASAFFGHKREGVIAGAVYLVYSAAFLGHDMLAVNAEILMMLPATAAALQVRNEQRAQRIPAVLSAGFLLGIAVLLKYQAAFWLPALAAAIYTTAAGLRRKLLLLCVLLAAFLAPLLATAATFAAYGGTGELVRWTLLGNIGYTANPIRAAEAAQRFAFKFLPFFGVTVFLWWAALRSTPLVNRYQRVLLSCLLLCTLPAAFLGFRFFPHYFIQFYIPLALASAPFLSRLLTPPLTNQAKWFLGYSLFVLAGFTLANAALYYGNKHVYEETDPVFRKVADRLRSGPGSGGETLFVWGFAPEFYYFADLPPASRFVVPQSNLTGYVAGNTYVARGHADTRLINPDDWKLLLEDLEKNKATYILDTAPARIHRWNYFPVSDFPLLSTYLQQHYRWIDTVDDVRIFRRTN